MAKKRVYEIAKERGVSSKELLAALQAAGIDVKAAASTIEEAEVGKVLTGDGAKPSTGGAEAPNGQRRRQEVQRPEQQGTARPAAGAQGPRGEARGPDQ